MALFLLHAETSAAEPVEAAVEPTSGTMSEVGSRRASMEFLLRLGGRWGRETLVGRRPYRTFEWSHACVLAGTPVWVLVLGWQSLFEDAGVRDAALESLPYPEDTPWLFMVEVWDTDISVPDYDARGDMLWQVQTRDFDLVAHTVEAILARVDVAAADEAGIDAPTVGASG